MTHDAMRSARAGRRAAHASSGKNAAVEFEHRNRSNYTQPHDVTTHVDPRHRPVDVRVFTVVP